MGNLIDLTDELETLEVSREYQPVPQGKYMVTIRNAELRPTNAGNGKYVKLEFEIVDGQYMGRRFWENCNTKNDNPVAQEIGRKTLSTIQKLCGIQRLTDTDQLLGHVIPVSVSIGPNNRDKTKLENKLRFALPAATDETGAPSSRPTAPASAGAIAGASKAPAWAQKRAVA